MKQEYQVREFHDTKNPRYVRHGVCRLVDGDWQVVKDDTGNELIYLQRAKAEAMCEWLNRQSNEKGEN